MWPDKSIEAEQISRFYNLIEKRGLGQPVAYLTGTRGFWSLDLKVTSATLIPRPDTELLVELALVKLKPAMVIADLGTGTGAIALSLAQTHPAVTIFAMDFSNEALKVAKENAADHDLNNVQFWQGSWLEAIKPNSLHMIISNPPYIEDHDPHLIEGDLRFEPRSALASGHDGLDDIRIIVKQAQQCLMADGWLMIEHGYHQAKQVQALFIACGFINVISHQDFGGHDRVVSGQLAL
jgi:release factor glutamine methyltransferase